jgi:ATP-dependent RNA helicase RhlE
VFIQVGSVRGPAQTITHEARLVHAKDKAEVLAKELRRERGTSIVFVNTKIGCDRLARTLQRSGLKAAAVHADRPQKERTQTIEMFRSGRIQVLVATDVAARGLDIDDVALVVNYEVPRSLDTYVHRVGRTGRRDLAGHALTLSDDFERSYLDSIDKAFGLKLFE